LTYVLQRLPTKHRPNEVAVWLKNGRRSQADQMPRLEHIEEYGGRWNTWWQAMQPSWRGESLSQVIPPEAGWSHLLCGGPNGVLTVILALAWWMQGSSRGTGTDLSRIEAAVEDVSWALVQLRMALVGDEGIDKNQQLEDSASEELPAAKKVCLSHCIINIKSNIT